MEFNRAARVSDDLRYSQNVEYRDRRDVVEEKDFKTQRHHKKHFSKALLVFSVNLFISYSKIVRDFKKYLLVLANHLLFINFKRYHHYTHMQRHHKLPSIGLDLQEYRHYYQDTNHSIFLTLHGTELLID
jgi:hypothetical protein